MDFEGIMLSKNKSDREKQIPRDFTYMQNPKSQIDRYKEQIGGC